MKSPVKPTVGRVARAGDEMDEEVRQYFRHHTPPIDGANASENTTNTHPSATDVAPLRKPAAPARE